MQIKYITNGFQAETIIKGHVSKVFDYWFHPPQIIPPLKKIVELDYRLGGFCKMICLGVDKKEVVVKCFFRSFLKDKELVYEWSTPKVSCMVSNTYLPNEDQTTKVICKQIVLRGHEYENAANSMALGYFAAMEAVFEKLHQKGLNEK